MNENNKLTTDEKQRAYLKLKMLVEKAREFDKFKKSQQKKSNENSRNTLPDSHHGQVQDGSGER